MIQASSTAGEIYHLAAVRLINWHNFVDETIRVDGSLFLIGDNGSGKTTLLDAIHCALTGNFRVELNAAARVGGRRDEGRDLKGIVLRYDAERGYQNPEGAVAYACLELRQAGGRQTVLSIGFGVYVRSPESAIESWGFLAARPIDEVPLVIDADGAARPADRSELQTALARGTGQGQVLDIGRYRTRVGERLFGSRDEFEQVANFLQAGKAYRELVTKTANFSELFSGLLPEPDVEGYHGVRRALGGIDRIRADLGALEEELRLLHDLIEWRSEVHKARETIARLEFLATHHRQVAAATGLQQAREQVERTDAQLAAAGREHRQLSDRLRVIGDELRGLRGTEAAELLARIADQRAELARIDAQMGQLRGELQQATAQLEECERERRARVESVSEQADLAGDALRSLHPAVTADLDAPELEAIGHLGEAFGLLGADARHAPFDHDTAAHDLKRLRPELERRLHVQQDRQRELAAAAKATRVHADELRQELAGLQECGELPPPLPGLAAAIELLAAAGISAAPLYKLLEPAEGLDAELVGMLERVLPARLLCTLVTDPADHPRAATILLEQAPGVPLAQAELGVDDNRGEIHDTDVRSLAELLVADPKMPHAEAFLHHHLGIIAWQPETPAGTGDGDYLTSTGHLHAGRRDERIAADPARWLGSAARQQAYQLRIRDLEADIADLDQQTTDLKDRSATASREIERLSTAIDVVARLENPGLINLHQAVAARDLAAEQARHAANEQTRLTGAFATEQERRGGVASTLATLKQASEQRGLERLRIRMEELEKEQEDTRDKEGDLRERLGELRNESGNHQSLCSDAAEQVAAREAELARSRTDLLPLIPEASRDDLDDYVFRHKRGNAIKPKNIATNQESARRRETEFITRITGGDGLRHSTLWQKYAFDYDEVRNELTDSTGAPIDTATGQLGDEVVELQESLRGKSEELFERLVLEELVGTLRREVFSLQGKVRDVNQLTDDLRFGRTRYRIDAQLKSDHKRVFELLRTSSQLGTAAREELKDYFRSRLEDFAADAEDELPPFLDYRQWFDFHLRQSTLDDEGVELSRERLRQGSGGEQAVPNYLVLFCLTALLYDSIEARTRLLLLDEAFYGVDLGRRESLLQFCERAGITLVVATPEMDGVTAALRSSTTIFIEKTATSDVYLDDVRYRQQPASLFEPAEHLPERMVMGIPHDEVSREAEAGSDMATDTGFAAGAGGEA